MSQTVAEQTRPDYRGWLRVPMVLIAALIVSRFVLEASGVPKQIAAVVSASVAGGLMLIYLGAVAPLHGIKKYRQMLLPALVFVSWVTAWDTLALVVSATFHLPGSHFADAPGILQNFQHVGLHVLAHIGLILPGTLFDFGLMSLMFFLYRWPVTVAPGAVLGGLVILRFASDAMHFAPTTASAWSSSVGALLGAIYLGGIGPRMGLVTARQLLVPSLVLGWVWRFWIFLAVLVSSTPLAGKTHFFDPTQGRVAIRLLQNFIGEFIIVGAIAGILVWGIAAWTQRALASPQTLSAPE